MTDKDESRVVIGFSVEAKLNSNRSIVAQTHVLRDASEEEINTVLDKVTKALDRQEAAILIKGLKITLERETNTLAQQIAKVADLEGAYEAEWKASNRRGPFKLEGQQAKNIANQKESIRGMRDRLDTIKRDINELERVVKGE